MSHQRTIPAGTDCLGCHYCEVRTAADKRNHLVCTHAGIASGPIPADVSACFVQEVETEGGDNA